MVCSCCRYEGGNIRTCGKPGHYCKSGVHNAGQFTQSRHSPSSSSSSGVANYTYVSDSSLTDQLYRITKQLREVEEKCSLLEEQLDRETNARVAAERKLEELIGYRSCNHDVQQNVVVDNDINASQFPRDAKTTDRKGVVRLRAELFNAEAIFRDAIRQCKKSRNAQVCANVENILHARVEIMRNGEVCANIAIPHARVAYILIYELHTKWLPLYAGRTNDMARRFLKEYKVRSGQFCLSDAKRNKKRVMNEELIKRNCSIDVLFYIIDDEEALEGIILRKYDFCLNKRSNRDYRRDDILFTGK